MEILSCKDLNFTYRGCKDKALENISFSVFSGELVLFMGRSGCGKTTLLRLLKPELAPQGKIEGEYKLGGKPVFTSDDHYNDIFTPKLGFVAQDPESQTVSDTVIGELSFGLDNMGLDEKEKMRRIGETVCYFGIEDLLHRELSTLSGGEKQLVNLCAAMTMRPEVLILDEPVSRLDPVTAEHFMSVLVRLNEETGITIIMAEHYCEGIFHHCSKVLFMEKGRLCPMEDFSPSASAKNCPEEFVPFLPCISRAVHSAALTAEKYPLTVRDGREFLRKNFNAYSIEPSENILSDEEIISCKDLWFRYDRDGEDIVKGLDMSVKKGELFTVIGSNGAGKSTLLKCIGGLLPPLKGRIKINGKPLRSYKNGSLYKNCVSVLPQNPYDIFIKQSVREDYEFALDAVGGNRAHMEKVTETLSIQHLMDMHPYDLSGGEAQLCAIGRLLLTKPKILLLDEPVKALDPYRVKQTGQLLKSLCAEGISIVCISHDLDFAAQYSDRCGLFFDGKLCACAAPQEFFAGSSLYTTAAQRISKGIFDGAVTSEQIINEIKRQVLSNENFKR